MIWASDSVGAKPYTNDAQKDITTLETELISLLTFLIIIFLNSNLASAASLAAAAAPGWLLALLALSPRLQTGTEERALTTRDGNESSHHR